MPTFATSGLSVNYRIPGVYVEVELGSQLGSILPNKRLLIPGYALSTSTKPFNVPWLPGTSREVREAHGPNSPITRAYEAAKSQLKAGIGAEIWIAPLPEPSGGTAATHFVEFMAAPSGGVLGAATAAAIPDTCRITFAGRGATFGIDAGDTLATIATKAKTALDAVPDLPVTISRVGAKLTATDLVKGELGNDMPIIVEFDSKGASGIAASPGVFEYTGTATLAGSATLGLNAHSASVTIGGTNTPIQSAQATVAKIRSDGYCVDAAIPGTPTDGKVTLFYRNGRAAHRLDIALVTVTGQTVAAAVGTLGVGTPDLTNLLTKLRSLPAFRVWALFWEDTSNWSSACSHIETEAASPKQKRQVVISCTSKRGELLRATNLPAATSPKLTSSPRYNLMWQQGAVQQGYELAVRYAAAAVSQDYQAPNLNAVKLKTADGVPLGIPDMGDRPTDDEVNLMIDTYHFGAIGVDGDGENAIIGSFTTYAAQSTRDVKYQKFSGIYAVDFMCDDMRYFLWKRFGQRNLKPNGKPRSARTVSPDQVKSAVFERILYYDVELDIYDGAKEMRDAVMAAVLQIPTRINVAAPLRPVADLDQTDILATAE